MSKSKSTPAYEKANIIDPGLPQATDQEKNLATSQTSLLDKAYSGLNNIAGNMDYSKYASQLYDPVAKEINSSYDKTFGTAANKAGNLGTLDSLGFADYVTGNLEKSRADSLASAKSNAELESYNLPNLLMSPYSTMAQLGDSSLSSLQDRINSNWNSALMRSQMLNNANLNQASQINAYNLNSGNNKSKFLGLF